MVIQDALYNVVRPQKFSEVVGQTNTIKAIKTALTKGVLEHSLIFYGQTGGGKTTTARIVAKWLQCDSKVDNEPCCQCETCRAIKSETFADYVELNASTNGGKDDIDRLLENISFAPQYGKCKVYVIDEAHCLTDGAWKSLLKPLEEPPAHVYFILCTTDFGSIPQTIKNRCGKYEFSRITKSDILSLLGDLRIKYKANYTNAALELLAESADGSLRNAVNNFSHISMPYEEGEEIDADSVKKYLALVGPETMAAFIKALADRDLLASMSIIDAEEKSAVNPDNFLKMILGAASDALTVSCGAELCREVSEEYLNILKEISALGIVRLSLVAGKLNETYSKIASRSYPSLRIMSAELCHTSTESGADCINYLAERLELLEKRMAETVSAQVCSPSSSSVQEEKQERVAMQEEFHSAEPQGVFDGYPSYDEYPEYPDYNPADFEQDNEMIQGVQPGNVDDAQENHSKSTEMDDIFAGFDFFDAGEPQKFTEPEMPENEESEEIPQEQMPEEHTFSNGLQFTQEIDNEEPPFTQDFGDYSGGITFENGSVAKAYANSKEDSSKIIRALKSACKELPLLEQLCDECCNCEVTGNGVVLATPFGPVAQVVTALLMYSNVSGVSIYPVDGIRIGG